MKEMVGAVAAIQGERRQDEIHDVATDLQRACEVQTLWIFS